MLNRDNYYLHQNILFLKKSTLDIENRLEKVNFASSFKISSAENGTPILYKNGICLNDKINPQKENSEILEKISNEPKIYIICGLELGYLLSLATEKTKNPIILYEKDLEIIKYVLSKINLTKILALKNVYFVTDKTEFKKTLTELEENNNLEKIILANKYYSNKYKELIQTLK